MTPPEGRPAAADGPLVAIDIGNTTVKWRVSGRGDDGAPARRVPLGHPNWPNELLRHLDVDLAPGQGVRFHVAAVNRPARDAWSDHLAGIGLARHCRMLSHQDLPMAVRLAHPERVGIDRLLAAWKATRLYRNRWLVVVDAGSAITIDCANPAGAFLGGAILPGVALQLDALGRGTDALPRLQFDADPGPLPAMPAGDTTGAIRAGVLLGIAAAIDALVQRTIAQAAADASWQVVLSGGDAPRLAPLLQHCHRTHANLVLDALLDPDLGG